MYKEVRDRWQIRAWCRRTAREDCRESRDCAAGFPWGLRKGCQIRERPAIAMTPKNSELKLLLITYKADHQ